MIYCMTMNRFLHSRRALSVWLSAVVVSASLLGLRNASAGALPPTEVSRSPIITLATDAPHHLLLKATTKALYRSADGGRQWQQIALPHPGAHIAAIATSSQQPGLLYIGGPGLGIFRSTDDGRHWESLNKGLPSLAVEALVAHADQPGTVYVYVAGHGIFRSRHHGHDWLLMDHGPRAPILHFIHSNMPGSMQTGWLFAATTKGVARSMDCFCGWQNAGNLTGKVSAITYDPRQPRQIYAAVGENLLLSKNGGQQWTHLISPAPIVSALLVTPDGVLYAAGKGVLFRSTDQAKTWERVNG